MTKQEYRDARRGLEIEMMSLEKERCDIEAKVSDLNIKKELITKQANALEKRRLDLEIDYTKAKINRNEWEDEEDEE